MPGGRPTTYTDEIADEICNRLIAGESLNKICFNEHIPSKATVYNWLDNPKRKEFLDKYSRARERQAENFVDECADIADFTEQDTITKQTKDGDEYEVPDYEWISRSKLRVDTRLKLAAILAPKKYGPKQEIDINIKDRSFNLKFHNFNVDDEPKKDGS